MGYYLLDHPNRAYKQYRETRRNGARPSGTVVLHTAENATDLIGPDGGAEAVAKFLSTRTTAGSYHTLCDADSTIQMAPWEYEVWHDTSTNNWAVGISGAIASADWTKLGERGKAIVIRMALAAREYAVWLKATRGITIPARRLTRQQALNREPGFIGHGEIDTGRRTDPGKDFDWGLFLAVFSGAPAPISITREDSSMIFLGRVTGDPQVWVGNIIFRRPVQTPQQLADIQYRINNNEMPGVSGVFEFESETRLNFIGMNVADLVWGKVLPVAEAAGVSVGPASAVDFIRSTALNTATLSKSGVKVEVDVDVDAISSKIVDALAGKVATPVEVEAAVRSVFRALGSS